MTFDEAIEKLEQLANFEVGKTTGNISRDFKIELGDVRDILAELREEYAPAVEMTKEQANHLKSLTTDVGNVFNEEELPADGSIKMTDKMIELDDSYIPLKYLNAVLHPETIKVVDE